MSETFKPPPHANAEVHAKIMADLKKMSAKEIAQTAVKAGIYTKDGELTRAYRDPPKSK